MYSSSSFELSEEFLFPFIFCVKLSFCDFLSELLKLLKEVECVKSWISDSDSLAEVEEA